VFAPTDEAFAKIPTAQLVTLLSDADALRGVLLRHIAVGAVSAADASALLAAAGEQATAIPGAPVKAMVQSLIDSDLVLTVADGSLFVSDARVIGADVMASNGIVHLIDTVLLPVSMVATTNDDDNTSNSGTNDGDMNGGDVNGGDYIGGDMNGGDMNDGDMNGGDMNDGDMNGGDMNGGDMNGGDMNGGDMDGGDMNGGDLNDSDLNDGDMNDGDMNGGGMNGGDMNGDNDVNGSDDNDAGADGAVEVELMTIAALAAATPELSTLVSALTTTDYIGALRGVAPLTVFAPTNDAFARLPAERLAALAADKMALRSLLSYHVVGAALTSSQAATLTTITSLRGEQIALKAVDGTLYLNDASKVVVADVTATNGVVHLIDTLLMPPAAPSPTPAPTPVSLPTPNPVVACPNTGGTGTGSGDDRSGSGDGIGAGGGRDASGAGAGLTGDVSLAGATSQLATRVVEEESFINSFVLRVGRTEICI
jgi:uncharacterized surface protein with fasciclin (FAS1) repeats